MLFYIQSPCYCRVGRRAQAGERGTRRLKSGHLGGGHHRRVQCGEVQPSDQRAGLQAPWSELEKHLWAAEQGCQPGWSGQLPKFFSWRDAGRSTGRTGPSWHTAHSYQPTWSCWGGKEEAFREASEVQNTEVNYRMSVILCWFISNKWTVLCDWI